VIKIISYNVHKGFSARNSDYVLLQIHKALESISPDIAFLQEVQGKHKSKRLKKIPHEDIPQIDILSKNLWPYTIYGKNATQGIAHHGNALLSKFEFSEWENIDVSFSKRASRSLLHGTIYFPADKIRLHVICIHLGLFKVERAAQLAKLSQRINDKVPRNEPLIIAGDFNDWRGHAENFLEKDLGMQETFKFLYGDHAKSFPATRPTFKVDRIYFRGINLRFGRVFWEPPWNTLSDHIPLYAEFDWL